MNRKSTSRKLCPDLIKATQAVLCASARHKVSLGTWSQGIDRNNDEVLIFIPEEALMFYRAPEFLKCLKDTWSEFGFYIIEETVGNNYNCIGGLASSICFRLKAA